MRRKRCFKCGRTKPVTSFYRHPKMADGYLNKCKECAKRDARNADPVKRAEYERERWDRPERREQVAASVARAKERDPARFARYQREYHQRHPERRKARGMVRRAVLSGKLEREPCEGCGSWESQAHHDDYAKPLEVRWLCSVCHGLAHRSAP